MIGIICIEGAGKPQDYPDSFMQQLAKNWAHGGWAYIHPDMSVNLKAAYAYTHALRMMKHPDHTALFVAGYGQGGAAALELCRILERDGKNIGCLALFDAVAPSHNSDVPANVQ